ncbi:ABC transporter substrate-binding protein [Paenibacillus koleovorans]|uniref:ABC transporter substrate-binding protein n=1 Tax=Paenibacillus koleovorans TaxID=121608 RepID=UPI000FDC28A8|nr:ABC transporter substrate-binding protein [Paenibacillus koleovorans]
MAGKKSILVSLGILLAFTTACSGSPSSTGPEASGAPSATVGDMSKKLEISWVGQLARGKVEDNNKVQQMLEKKFNVKLINKKIDINNTEQRNLMVASGELPDYSYMLDDVGKLYRDGVTRSIPKELIVKYAPKYAALLDSVGTGWKVNEVPGKPGEYYALTGYVDTVENLFWGQAYRLDWMEKLGFKPKGKVQQLGTSGGLERIYYTTEAFTIEEETKMYEAFVNQDPDGNGKKDTYGPMFDYEAPSNTMANLAGAFGFGWGQFIEESGKLVNYAVSAGYKSFLKNMADWYKKGIIDPEFTTLNLTKSWEKYATGKYGGVQALHQSAALVSYTHTRPPGNLVLKEPNAKILFAPPPIGPQGKQGAPTNGNGVDGFSYTAVIRKDVSDEKLIRILQMFDYINLDPEGNLFTQFGEEGIDFKWEGTPKKSAVLNNRTDPERDALGIGYYNHVMRPAAVTPLWNDSTTVKLFDAFWGVEAGRKLIYANARHDYFNETKYNELRSKYTAKLKTITDEYLFKAITGEINIDATWDNYVKNYLDNGGRELTSELEKAPRVADLRKK